MDIRDADNVAYVWFYKERVRIDFSRKTIVTLDRRSSIATTMLLREWSASLFRNGAKSITVNANFLTEGVTVKNADAAADLIRDIVSIAVSVDRID